MEKRINWLHLSDLHYGQKKQNILLPKLKKELFKDIERLRDDIGKLDLVFFTGDLTFSGKKEEFDELTIFLQEMWAMFGQIGCSPLLIAIPGNHDLQRPELRDPIVKVLRRYHEDSDTRDEFWNDFKHGPYAGLLSNCFENFNNWYQKIELPKPAIQHGLIPGDIAATIMVDGIKVKVVGLNTAFLELASDDYIGKLALSPLQVQCLTESDHLKWIEEADIALLLTHHDTKWYDSDSLDRYNGDINPPDTFFNHLCGHLHKPSMNEYGDIGSPKRRIQLAPSLFGLEKVNGIEDRIHGYIAGSYIFKESELIEHIFPRTAHKNHNGGNYQIAADYGFPLNKRDYIEVIHAKRGIEESSSDPMLDVVEDLSYVHEEVKMKSSESQTIFDTDYKKRDSELESVPRVDYLKLPQHTNIRLVEQEKFTNALIKNRYCWLITDWSLGEEEFIGSVIERLGVSNKNNFVINCEDASTEDGLFEIFKEQAGMPFPYFCTLMHTLESHLLVFNQVHPMLYRNPTSYRKFVNVIKTVTDFCPNTFVILIARQTPDEYLEQNLVRIKGLDAPEVKTYIESHPNSEDILTRPESLDKLIGLTGGLPSRIDKFMTNLKYASFQELTDSENEIFEETLDVSSIPKSLQHTLNFFSESTDRYRTRSFKLLKILTILAYGETFNNLKRFVSTEPIGLQQIAELESFSLLEIIVKNRVFAKIDNDSDSHQTKLFRVPRQVVNFINTMITENERDEILKNACNLYFGAKWREGSIKNIRSSTFQNQNKYLNIDNCQLIVRSLLSQAIKKDNEFEIERAANLAVNYCEHLYEIDDYKNAQATCEEIYNLLRTTGLNRLKATVAKISGKSLRMNGFEEKALRILNEALELEGNIFSNYERNSILTDCAFAHLSLDQNEKAFECAKLIEKTAEPNGSMAIQAKYIIAEATLKGDELLSKLRKLEKTAQKANADILANNISISIAHEFSDYAEREKRYSKIISKKADEYNAVRAIIPKVLDALEANHEVSNEDLNILNMAYYYLYGQRMASLFDKCHKALWLFCLKNSLYPQLFNLFRHSSFVWRIMGKETVENEYFKELSSKFEEIIGNIQHSAENDLSIKYFTGRKLEIEGRG